jgi:hypothetical protein
LSLSESARRSSRMFWNSCALKDDVSKIIG